ncbi:MAG: GGDEF domain-containing protein [Prevotella sp.]|nr:GGDEF domain-containing protein [Alistipes senegalensis]MCM1357705.1 GGDEF domain-containing protein [Prevotella sp.]MCM1473392.1 GGDEF domain-containing protein [Muribaculaceae bacterium]
MSKSIQKKITNSIMIIAILFIILNFVFSVLCINFISRKYQRGMAASAVAFAEAVINADDAKDFLTTRTANNYYKSVQEKLIEYQKKNSSAIISISLINFSNSAGNYIYDTSGKELGSRLEYNDYISSVKTDLIGCRNSWSVYYNKVLNVFQPLRTVEDKSAGYIIVTVRKPFNARYILYIAVAYLVILIVSIGFVIFFNLYMKKQLFSPINVFIETTRSFTGENHKEITDNPNIFAEGRDDEIGQLGSELKKMLLNINSNVENLSKAVYDANHDGMTQVLNKRCYQNMTPVFRKCSSICVIYFDVNNLKIMNDTMGHEKGDMVIKRAAEYIKQFTGQKDYCFRMGGDEFLMVMTECTFREIDELIEKLNHDSPYILNRSEDPVKCALSFGYAYAKEEYSYDELLTEAEENMYTKKTELKKLLNMPER